MGQVVDDIFLVVHALPDQVGREHLGEVRDTAQQADKGRRRQPHHRAIGQRRGRRRTRQVEQTACADELSGAAQRNDGLLAAPGDGRHFDPAAFDEDDRITRVALFVDRVAGRKLTSRPDRGHPGQDASRIESFFLRLLLLWSWAMLDLPTVNTALGAARLPHRAAGNKSASEISGGSSANVAFTL